MPIYVTKPYLPPKDEYLQRVSDIFDRKILTNQGPEVAELEKTLHRFLGVKHFQYVTNGTVAIQIALRALGITEGEVITTPFSYVATISSILWEHCKPVFVDIEPHNFTIDPNKIEEAITPHTKAILPVHVFGYACDVDTINEIAQRHNIKVIYDAAHTFGATYKGRALASYGDISTLSFHATKLFHTLEGGACIVREQDINARLELIKHFGHIGDIHKTLGINAKQDELNAAMGNVVFKHFDEILTSRKIISKIYDNLLGDCIIRPREQKELQYNYAYYPIIFKSENQLLHAFKELNKNDIYPRRYFYPSLNTLPYLSSYEPCPISEDISSRIACLPLYTELNETSVELICSIIKSVING